MNCRTFLRIQVTKYLHAHFNSAINHNASIGVLLAWLSSASLHIQNILSFGKISFNWIPYLIINGLNQFSFSWLLKYSSARQIIRKRRITPMTLLCWIDFLVVSYNIVIVNLIFYSVPTSGSEPELRDAVLWVSDGHVWSDPHSCGYQEPVATSQVLHI